MPWSTKQRKLFHEAAEHPAVAREHEMSSGEARKLADEADKLKKEGKEKKASFVDLRPTLWNGL